MVTLTMQHRTTRSHVFLSLQLPNLVNKILVSLYKCPLIGDKSCATYKWKNLSLLTVSRLYFFPQSNTFKIDSGFILMLLRKCQEIVYCIHFITLFIPSAIPTGSFVCVSNSHNFLVRSNCECVHVNVLICSKNYI